MLIYLKQMTIEIAIKLLTQLFDKAGVDSSHGIIHAMCVITHTEKALTYSINPGNIRKRIAIKLAALLHDADDHKFFNTIDYSNARMILLQAWPKYLEYHELVIEMIDLVSCSKNGNSKIKKGNEWMLIPRWCDRLEAMGKIGIRRAHEYTKYKNAPLFLPTTLKATNMKELVKIASKERFKLYTTRCSSSLSMIDHFYDKLLHICSEDIISDIDNPYLRSEMQKRRKITINFVLKFGNEGEIDVCELNRIRAKEWK